MKEYSYSTHVRIAESAKEFLRSNDEAKAFFTDDEVRRQFAVSNDEPWSIFTNAQIKFFDTGVKDEILARLTVDAVHHFERMHPADYSILHFEGYEYEHSMLMLEMMAEGLVEE